MLKKKFMICALGLCVFGGNAYAHDISVQKLKYDNNQGIATKWSKSDGDATFSLYRVNESNKPMELAAKIEKDGGDKVGEVSITDDGIAKFTGLDTGHYVLVETKHSGTHAKPMYFYLDKNVSVYTKNFIEDSGDGKGDKSKDKHGDNIPPGKSIKNVPSLIQKTDVYKTVKYLADTGLTSSISYISGGILAVIATLIYRNKRNKK